MTKHELFSADPADVVAVKVGTYTRYYIVDRNSFDVDGDGDVTARAAFVFAEPIEAHSLDHVAQKAERIDDALLRVWDYSPTLGGVYLLVDGPPEPAAPIDWRAVAADLEFDARRSGE